MNYLLCSSSPLGRAQRRTAVGHDSIGWRRQAREGHGFSRAAKSRNDFSALAAEGARSTTIPRTLAGLLLRNLGAFLARFRQPNCDRLLPARYPATLAAFA